jgi:hypothetical protein
MMVTSAVIFDELDSTETEESCRNRLNDINNNSTRLLGNCYGNTGGRTLLQRMNDIEKEIRKSRKEVRPEGNR